jgi:hypothetical protein
VVTTILKREIMEKLGNYHIRLAYDVRSGSSNLTLLFDIAYARGLHWAPH